MYYSTRIISSLTAATLLAFSQGAFAQTTAAKPPVPAPPTPPMTMKDGTQNPLLYALAWKQTAAEYRALYYQGYNIAKMRVDEALAKRKKGDKPLAVITDIDDTILLPLPYWRLLVEQNIDFFDDAIWDKWVPKNEFVAAPGALDFLNYCKSKGVEVFYISSRDQGEKTFEYGLGNLKHLGFPIKDDSHVTILRDTSNKEKRQDEIMLTHNVVVSLGDNLNDFRRKYYIKSDVNARMAKMEEDRNLFGSKYILFPNPTDGHWLAAIFGQSEPEATPANREILRKAAMGQ